MTRRCRYCNGNLLVTTVRESGQRLDQLDCMMCGRTDGEVRPPLPKTFAGAFRVRGLKASDRRLLALPWRDEDSQ